MAFIKRIQEFGRRYPDVTGPMLLLGLVIAVFWPLLMGKAFFYGDLELQFYPWGEFWHRELQRGNLPLWNPYMFGGASFAGNPQIGLLYPPSLLLCFLPPVKALTLSALLHIWASGAVFFLWLRRGRLELSPNAALLGATSWMLGGAFISKTQFPNMLAAVAYLPAVIWAIECVGKRSRSRSVALLGGVLGLQLLAGHAQISLYTIYFGLFYGLWLTKAVRRVAFIPTILSLAVALSLALLIDAGQLVPVIENLRGAERQTLSIGEASRFVLPVWAVTNLFAPYLYGNPNSGTWTFHGGGAPWETACYLGVIPFLFALPSMSKCRFWSVAALAALLLAMGPLGGLYIVAFHGLPGISRFHDAARFLMLASFALSVLAAVGYQKFHDLPRLRAIAPLVLLLATLDLGYFARNFYPLRQQTKLQPLVPKFIADDPLISSGQARIWAFNPKKTRSLFLNYGNYTQRTPQHDSSFPLGSIPNTHIWAGLLEAGGYDPIASASVANRLKGLEIAPELTKFPEGYASKLGKANIRLLVLWRKQPLAPSAQLREVQRGTAVDGERLYIYRNEACRPRGQVCKQRSTRVSTYDGGCDQAQVLSTSTNTLEVDVPPANSFDQVLEIADNFAPGWRAFERGSELQVTATEAGFIGVNLKQEEKRRRVRLVYEPQSYRLGVFISLCALSVVTAVFCATKKPETK